MDKVFTVAQIIVPIFAAIFLGVFARRKAVISPEGVRGLQQFVIQFALPCVLFNSCLGADLGTEALTTVVLVFPLLLSSTLWAFRAGKKKYPYHNLPMLFAAQESGMLGIPLYMVLFGAGQAYRMGVLDMAQAFVAIPVIAILAADAGKNPSPTEIAKKVITSPLLLMGLLGLVLNLTGAAVWLDGIGLGGVIRGTTSFLAQPVSAVMLFTVGYNFSMAKGSRTSVFQIAGIHFALLLVFCLVIQAGLLLVKNVEAETRWAVLMFCTLPASFLAPGLGRSEEDSVVASGVCSVLTVVSLIVFCGIAAAVA
ncbi:MAG: AEC family transporter [Faecousia sp.]